MYAILSHGGRQHRVSAGDRLVVDRLDAEVGSVIALEPVLLTGGEGSARLGDDVDGVRVAVTVVKHLRGERLRIFKYKPKKRSRKAAGYRSELTELRVESILVKGATLPSAPASDAVSVGAPQEGKPEAAAEAVATPTVTSATSAPEAAASTASAAAGKRKLRSSAGPRRAPAATATSGQGDDGGATGQTATEEAAPAEAPPPKRRTARAPKSATKTSTSNAAATDKDGGDGA